METVAKARYLKISPVKLRSVADLVRGKNINKAFGTLAVTQKKGCLFVDRALKNAVNNIQNKDVDNSLDVDALYIKEIFVDEGPSLKRWMPRAMGRATKIKKRTSHLTVCLAAAQKKGKEQNSGSKG